MVRPPPPPLQETSPAGERSPAPTPVGGGALSPAPARGLAPELVLLACSVASLALDNRRFLGAALNGHDAASAPTWWLAGSLVVGLLAINFLIFGLLAWGRLLRPVAFALLVVAAIASHFTESFGTYIDTAMLRNALHTDWHEARELLGPRLGLALLLGAVLPGWLLWRLPIRQRPWRRALAWRLGALALALAALVAALLVSYQPLASLMRNQRELRYLVTPGNVLWSAANLARDGSRTPRGPLVAVGGDARPGATLAAAVRPRLVVFVVGETARAANWGLNGYTRQTTPELARLPVISFPNVTSCGTDTETSLPCMFAAVGRRDYDARRIRGHENLLHVLARAGVRVHWRDNQSGCKGVCEGFPFDTVAQIAPPGSGLCNRRECFDEGLLLDLPALTRPAAASGPGQGQAQVLVLHPIGNHGPSYHRRVPPSFKRFQPACESDELQRCSTEEIVNAYDNALLYTDHVLARLIGQLQARAAELDSAVLYVSDHGESLGEHRLFLHGIPYAIAPDVQKRVPMTLWLSPGFAASRGLDGACLGRKAGQVAASHDHLFHTVLGLVDITTGAREAAWDLTEGCTRAPSRSSTQTLASSVDGANPSPTAPR